VATGAPRRRQHGRVGRNGRAFTDRADPRPPVPEEFDAVGYVRNATGLQTTLDPRPKRRKPTLMFCMVEKSRFRCSREDFAPVRGPNGSTLSSWLQTPDWQARVQRAERYCDRGHETLVYGIRPLAVCSIVGVLMLNPRLIASFTRSHRLGQPRP